MATNTTAPKILDANVIQRGVKRLLPCKLTDTELLQIALQRTDKEALRDDMVADFDRHKAKHKAALEEIEDEIKKAYRELHTREQDRSIPCTALFRRADDGSGWVDTIRTDSNEVVETRPCTPSEAQRYLPGVEGAAPADGPILDETEDAGDDEDEEDLDDGINDLTPAQKAAKEAKAARKARAKGRGK